MQLHQKKNTVLFAWLSPISKQQSQLIDQYAHKVDPAEAEQFDQLHHISWAVVHGVLYGGLTYRSHSVQARRFREFILANGH